MMAILFSLRWFVSFLTFASLATASHDRLFSAARKSATLRRRTYSLAPKYDGNVVYYIDDMRNGAKVTLKTTIPLLIIEDVEDIIQSVQCSKTSVTLSFTDSLSFEKAVAAWTAHDYFAILTNHVGCQKEDEHGVWRIQTIEHQEDLLAIELFGEPSSLRTVSPRVNIELGSHLMGLSNSHSLSARQEELQSTGTFTTSSIPTATFTFQSPTASATGCSLSSNISFSRLNTTLLPPDSSIVNLIPHASALDNVRLSCRNCTMAGNIELTAGGFSANDTDMEMLSDFVDDGYLQFKMTNLSAMMDFELAFLPGFSLFEFTAQLPSIPLGAIDIAGLLKFGPILDLTFPISVTLNSPVTLRTGFTLTAPPIVDIYLNMSNPKSSYTTGFPQAKLEALPFTADAQNLSMNLTTGFKPQLVLGAGLGIDAFNASAQGGVGVYLDLPQLAATVDLVDKVNEKCEPATSNSQNNLIRVGSSVTYDGGAQWDLSADVLGIDYEKGEQVPWASNTTALATQCLMWDEGKKALVKATALPTTTSPSATATPSGQAGTAGPATGSSKNTASEEVVASTFSLAVLCMMMVLLL